MEQYYYKVVYVDDTNPIEYAVLEEKNLDSLDDIHDFVTKHIHEHLSKQAKWILLPFRKDDIHTRKSAAI